MDFFVRHIKMLLDGGNEVELACNFARPPHQFYLDTNCLVHDLPFSRSLFSAKNIKAYKGLKKLINDENYDIVHTHTPIASVYARLACRGARKRGTRVFYTAHGFHFFKDGSLKNWLLYYPVERYMARHTDVMITICCEDYKRAKRFMADRVKYISGIGIDISAIEQVKTDRKDKRTEVGIPTDALLLLSVGELNRNKNHEVVLKVLATLKALVEMYDIHYLICGVGSERDYLDTLCTKLNLAERVHFLGLRSDVIEIMKTTDIFVHPSKREGLSVALMEAMACGLPIICAKIRGNVDLIKDGEGGILCENGNIATLREAIRLLGEDSTLRQEMGSYNLERVKEFGIEGVLAQLAEIYDEVSLS
jgi:glycosyltransferase involved in cell wall biosynthesis